MSQTANKLTIRNKSKDKVATGGSIEVLLDGVEMKGLTFLKIEAKPRQVVKVTMEMVVDLEVDLENANIDVKTAGNHNGPKIGSYESK